MFPSFDLNVYDCEGTDLDVRHGQLTEFAAIRADEKFDVLEETEARIRRLPYLVPSPEALAVTGTDPFDLDDDRLPTEFEASAVIEKALRPRLTRQQVNLTFNGLRYDDEMIRTMLFRNLRKCRATSAGSCIQMLRTPVAIAARGAARSSTSADASTSPPTSGIHSALNPSSSSSAADSAISPGSA